MHVSDGYIIFTSTVATMADTPTREELERKRLIAWAAEEGEARSGSWRNNMRKVVKLLRALPPAAADGGVPEGEIVSGYRRGWYWLRLNADDPFTRRAAGTWICVEWRGAGVFTTLGVQWADADSIGDETAHATLGPYLGTAPAMGKELPEGM